MSILMLYREIMTHVTNNVERDLENFRDLHCEQVMRTCTGKEGVACLISQRSLSNVLSMGFKRPHQPPPGPAPRMSYSLPAWHNYA